MENDALKTLLLVEDELIIAMAGADLLRGKGFAVVVAGSGEEALQIALSDRRIDLILMDIDLGRGMDGTEAARRILERKDIPIVFLTSHSEREMVERVRTITRYGYVLKNSGDFVLFSSIEMAFELHDAHRETREREAKFRLLAENSMDVIWTMTLDGRFTYVSPAIEDLFGFTPEEMLGLPLDRHVAVPGAGELMREIATALAKPPEERLNSRSIEMQMYRKDGTLLDTEVNVGWLLDGEGNPAGIQGSTRDIGKRKQLERERERQLGIFKALYDLALSMSDEHQLADNLNFIVERASALLGTDCSFIGLFDDESEALAIKVHSGIRTDVFKNLSFGYEGGIGGRALADRRGYIVENYLESDDFLHSVDDAMNAEGLISGMVVPIQTAEKNLGALFSFNRRETRFKQGDLDTLVLLGNLAAVEILRDRMKKRIGASEQRLFDIIDFMPDPTFAVDAGGRVIAWNRNMEAMTGIQKGEMLGKGDYAYAYPFYGDRRRLLIDLVLQEDIETVRKYDFVHQKGNAILAEVHVPGLYGGRGAYLWGIAAPLYDRQGRIAGAIECIRDITDRKEDEQRLREANENLRKSQEIARLGDWSLDLLTGRFNASPEALRIMGFPPGYEPAFREVSDLIVPEDRHLATEALTRVLPAGGHYSVGFRITKRDTGELRHLVSMAQVVLGEGGIPVRVLGINQDDTERRDTERRLGETEERYRRLFEHAIIGIYQSTPGGRFISVNPACAMILGYGSPEEAMSSIADIATQVYRNPGDRDRVKRLLQEKGEANVETLIKKKDGSEAWLQHSMKAVYGAHGEIEYYEGFVSDITERKKAEMALAENERLYRLITDNTADNIWIMNLDLQFIYISPSILRVRGYTVEEAMAQTIDQVLTPQSVEIAMKALQEELEIEKSGGGDPGRTRSLVFEEFHKSGATVWLDNSLSFLRDGQGRVTGILGVTRDITGQKRAEEQIQRLLGEKDLLLREVHHRIKNNMVTISTLLSLQENMVQDPKAVSALADARNRIQGMMGIYDTLYRSDEYQQVMMKRYLSDLIDDIARTSNIRGGAIAIHREIEEIRLDTKSSFPLGIIVSELISNSLKYAFPGGRKGTIRAELRKTVDNSFLLRVADDGIGLPDGIDIQNPVGFGLNLVKVMVQQLKGTIAVERRGGTLYTVEFGIEAA